MGNTPVLSPALRLQEIIAAKVIAEKPLVSTDFSNVYDVIIIGGGPAGLSAALMLGRSCRRVVVIDAGKPRNATAREIHGFLGRDATNPHDLVHDGRRELASYGVEIMDDVVSAAEKLPTPADGPCPTAFIVTTQGGRTVKGRQRLRAGTDVAQLVRAGDGPHQRPICE